MYATQNIAINWENLSNGQYSTQYQSVMLAANQCIDTSISPWELNINQDGYYTIQVTADSGNSLNDSNRTNNVLSQNIYIRH